MLTHYMRMHLLPLFYTLTGLFSDDSRFAYPDTGCFILLIRYLMRPDMLRGVLSSLYPITGIFTFFYFLISLILDILDSLLVSFLYSFVIMCGHYIYCWWYWFIKVDFIACSGYFRLNVYTWGFLLTYMHHRLSSRLFFHVFWEAGRNKFRIW